MWTILLRLVAGLITTALPVGLVRANKILSHPASKLGGGAFLLCLVLRLLLNRLLYPFLRQVGLTTRSSGWHYWIFAALYGLSYGVTDQGCHYLLFKYWISGEDRPFKAAVSLGLGHAGTGVLCRGIFLVLVSGSFLWYGDHMDTFMPLERTVVAPVEALSQILMQVSASSLVWQAVKRRQGQFLVWAIAFQTLLESLNITATHKHWRPLIFHPIISVPVALLSAIILYAFAEPTRQKGDAMQSTDRKRLETPLLLPDISMSMSNDEYDALEKAS